MPYDPFRFNEDLFDKFLCGVIFYSYYELGIFVFHMFHFLLHWHISFWRITASVGFLYIWQTGSTWARLIWCRSTFQIRIILARITFITASIIQETGGILFRKFILILLISLALETLFLCGIYLTVLLL